MQLPTHPARPAQPPRQLCQPTSSDPWPVPVRSRTTPACLPAPAHQPASGFLSMKWGCLSYSVGEVPANSFREPVPQGWEYQPHSMFQNFVQRAGRKRSREQKLCGRNSALNVGSGTETQVPLRDVHYVLECASAFHILIRTACGHACAYNANQALLCSAFHFLCFCPLPSPLLNF